MAVNTRTEYALRVLLELSQSDMLSAAKICEAQQLPKKYIEHLLAMLKNAGIVSSTAGSQGGYSLAKGPDQISFLDLLNAVGDRSYDTSCEIDSPRHCIGKACNLTNYFSELNDKIKEVFRTYSLADIKQTWKGENNETR